MPIIKTKILGSQFEINYEEKEYDKLINLINNFKKRLSEFPNDGRTSNNFIIFLTALKIEDELEELKKLNNKSKDQQNIVEDQNLIIEKLKKEIVLLNDNIKQLESNKRSEESDFSKTYENISQLESEIEIIKRKIKTALDE
tara:strand:+ start:186 stop:611 length:426 start_codon:yes stop_codon:yes gene_type:complete